MLEKDELIVKPYVSLLLCRLIGARSEVEHISIYMLRNELKRVTALTCPKSVQGRTRTPAAFSLSFCELVMSILYAELDVSNPHELEDTVKVVE